MLSPFWFSVCTSSAASRQWLKITLHSVVGAIAVSLSLGVRSATADIPLMRPVSTKVTFLQAAPHSTVATDLGTWVATNYKIYCGAEGTPLTTVVSDRPLCDNTSIGGDLAVPVVETVIEPLWYSSPLQEPFVLQQSDKTLLFPQP